MSDSSTTPDSNDSSGLIQQLQLSLSRMEFALAQVDEAIVRTDAQGQIEWCNSAFDRLVDCPHSTLLHQPLNQVLPLKSLLPTSPTVVAEPHYVQLGDRSLWLEVTAALSAEQEAHPALYVLREAAAQVPLPSAQGNRIEQTRLNQARMQLALDYSNIGSWIWHVATGEVIWDENTERLMGYQPGESHPSYQLWQERVHPDDWARVEQTTFHYLSINQNIDVEYRIVQPDGNLRWVMDRSRGLRNAAGEVVEVRGLLIDITDRKQTEMALAESEAILSRLAENVPGMIYRYVRHPDGSHRFTYVSPRVQDIYEVEPDAVIHNPETLCGTFHPDDLPLIQSSLAAQTQSLEPWHIEHRIITPDGRLKWIEISAQPEQQPNGDVIWDGVATEISDRKRVETQLKQQQAFLHMVIDTNPNLIFVKDWEGRYLLANKAMAEFYDTTIENLIGKTVADFYLDPTVVNLFLNQNQWVIRHQQPLFIPEEKIESCHHDIEWLQWQKQPIQLPNREEYGVLGIGVNITARKRIEAALESILQGTASATGADFFPRLVQSLVSALGVRHAVVTELVDDQTLRALAFWSNDQINPNPDFDLRLPLPCGRTLEQGVFICPNQLQDIFPNSEVLTQLEAESYLGVALKNNEGRSIGTICILDTKPVTEVARSEALLRIFASRAAAELERKRAIAALHRLNQDLEARVAERTQELVQFQVELQNQTHLLQTILNSMGDGLMAVNSDGQFLVFNPAARRILGISASAISPANWMKQCSMYLSDRLTPCPPDQFPLNRAIRGETADNVEIYIHHPELEKELLLDITICPFYDKAGQIAGGMAVFRDITRKRATEEALRQREQEFRTLVEHSPDTVIRFDRQIRYLYVNPKLAQETGIATTQFIGKTPAEMGFPAPLAAYWTQVVQQVFATGTEQMMEYEIDLALGKQVDEARCVPELDTDGSVKTVLIVARHITALKQAEADLRASESRFRAIFENSPIAIGIANVETQRFIQCNPAHIRQFGYGAAEIVNSTIADITYPDDMSVNLDYIQQLVAGTIARFQMEKRFICKDGQIIWCNLTVALIRDAHGHPRYTIGMTENITERKRSEAALRRSEARLRRIIDSNMMGIFFSNAAGLITEANDAFLNNLGYSRQDLAQRQVHWGTLSPSEPAALNQQLTQELEQYRVSSVYETEFVRKDGTKTPVLIGIAMLEEGQDDAEVGFVLDIADRKQAERRLLIVQEQLFLAQERLHHLLSSSPAIIYSATPCDNPTLTFISTNITVSLGYASQECLEPNFWLSVIHPGDVSLFTASGAALLQQGYAACEYRLRHKNGSYRWLYDQTRLVRDEAGVPLERIGSWIDISDRKAAEEQLYQTNERLARANAELAHATRLKDEFLSNMSHELRTPLNSILGLSEVMQEEMFGSLTQKQRQFLVTIQESGNHLLDLINDILDLAKIEAGMLEIHLTETSIYTLCET
ncbi:MAG TPA: PAS domain S-box protein, partial [Coleofasciculaceae cyanobacterium]